MTDSPSPSADEPLPDIEALWHGQRRRLLDIGYRMLGSVTDAEDLATEAYARLLAADFERIDDPVGWLVAVMGRLCIDRMRSAENRRRAYVGPWLPEPLVNLGDSAATDPADRITLDDSVKMALLVVLEQLSPAERTAFVLHDLFAVSFDEVATIVGRTPAACRQLASRARRRIQADPEAPRTSVSKDELEVIARRFAEACGAGSVEPLLAVLDPDVVGDFDSGGVIPGAPTRPLQGAANVAQLLVHTFSDGDFSFLTQDVNGEPGIIIYRDGRLAVVGSIMARSGKVTLLHAVGNPEKLAHLY